MKVAEKIYEHVKALPESTAEEVFDFVEFLENKLIHSKKYGRMSRAANSKWPNTILAFEGVPDMPPFEEDRAHLLPPSEDPLI